MIEDESRGRPALQLWGGVECTINRVHDCYFEQLKRSGHSSRLDDFERFAQLGVKALRHPILWEAVAPLDDKCADWNWADASLHELRRLNIRPIVGLLHHGSGPSHTDLLDPQFPRKLSQYAAAVARRYPDLQDYTPVNEPLTTARFSALYGHWYPHHANDLSFARALLTQCRAVVLAMQAIRDVNPSARLIQTDDLGKIFSTPKLAYQAHFENERRWATYDLLCGKLDRGHVIWEFFRQAGVEQSELQWFLDHPCPPDVIGINQYLSGQRYLDEHLGRYPAEPHGGNATDRYVDVLAARVLRNGAACPKDLLREAWMRYRIPVAITECHNGCTREEQLRWFAEVWRDAEELRKEGAAVLAVTAWSLLGAFDWQSLVTREDNCYEPGTYDVRSSPPRPTALAGLITSLGQNKKAEHPLLKVPGWWRRDQRLIYGFSLDEQGNEHAVKGTNVSESYPDVPPILITGARGTLGRAFARICQHRGMPYRLIGRQTLDIADPISVRRVFDEIRPWAVVNAAGYVRVDDAENDVFRCLRENAQGPESLANECQARGIPFLTFSSDLVFDGATTRPYVEKDPVAPLNQYGKSKVEAERRVLSVLPSALVIRTSAFFGPWDEYNFAVQTLRELAADRVVFAPEDVIVSPTYVPDLVNACLDLLIDGESGIWHVASEGQVSWAEFGKQVAGLAGVSTTRLIRCKVNDLHLPAKRPLFTPLTSQRAVLLPDLQDALRRFFIESEIDWRAQQRQESAA